METLQIKKEAAITAHENAKSSGRKLLEDLFGKRTFQKDVMERIKTFDDVLAELGTPRYYFDEGSKCLTEDETAYRKVKMIVQVLNEGWMPDWNDSNQTKYYPWFDMRGSSGSGFSCDDCDGWCSFSDVGSRLCFKSRELAEYAGKQFENIYKQFFTA